MRNIVLVLIIPVLLATGGCRKELPFDETTPVDTLFPRPYFPIYPGSWWRYQNMANATFFTDTAGPYIEASMSYGDFHSQPYIVPTFDGVPYFGYGLHKEFSSYYVPYAAFSYILSETRGDSWIFENQYVDPRYNSGVSTYRFTDSVGLVKNMDAGLFTDVIKIREVNYRSPYTINYYYYAKDVGLIEKGQYNTSTGQMISTYQLDSYFINH